jgi:hypothetical protein
MCCAALHVSGVCAHLQEQQQRKWCSVSTKVNRVCEVLCGSVRTTKPHKLCLPLYLQNTTFAAVTPEDGRIRPKHVEPHNT